MVQVHPGPPLVSMVTGCCPKTSTHNPTHKLLHRIRNDSERRQIFLLRGPCFIAVVLRVQIESRLNLCVTQDALYSLGFDFRLVHQPVGKRATQVVKSKPLAVLDGHSGLLCRRSQMIGDENRRGEEHGRALSKKGTRSPLPSHRGTVPAMSADDRAQSDAAEHVRATQD